MLFWRDFSWKTTPTEEENLLLTGAWARDRSMIASSLSYYRTSVAFSNLTFIIVGTVEVVEECERFGDWVERNDRVWYFWDYLMKFKGNENTTQTLRWMVFKKSEIVLIVFYTTKRYFCKKKIFQHVESYPSRSTELNQNDECWKIKFCNKLLTSLCEILKNAFDISAENLKFSAPKKQAVSWLEDDKKS